MCLSVKINESEKKYLISKVNHLEDMNEVMNISSNILQKYINTSMYKIYGYKLLVIDTNNKYHTPYQYININLNKLEKSKNGIKGYYYGYYYGYDMSNTISVNYGIHFFDSEESAIKGLKEFRSTAKFASEIRKDKKYIIVKCYIPENVPFIIGRNNDIVAEQLFITDEIVYEEYETLY